MYQFIVSTRGRDICVSDEVTGWSGAAANVGELPDMSHAGNVANKWASRAVVALQLAAWSAVGIVLLEKGITTLRKNSHSNRNASLEITTPIASSDWLVGQTLEPSIGIAVPSENDTDLLSVIPLDADKNNDPDTVLEPHTRPQYPWTELKNVETPKTHLRHSDEISIPNESSPQNNGEINKSKQKLDTNIKDPPVDTIKTNPVTIKVLIDNLEEHRWESRKRLRVGRVHGGSGIAAAVAMVAVGSVMLVLGPAVIVLRALDERRQERRFLKLSGEEDLPPSYEQATCELEPAPTYSSLNLDSIMTIPPQPIDPNCSTNSRAANC